MKDETSSDEEFFKKYTAYERSTLDDWIKRYGRTEEELWDVIDYLIDHRQLLRDIELAKLEEDCQKMLKKFQNVKLQKVLEEVQCFKDILALQKRLLKKQ